MGSERARVVVGLSGGVDSSVAAWSLREQGYDVVGLFMKNWEEDDGEGYCAAAEDLEDARAVCDRLGIALRTVNFASEYWERVFAHFLAEYRAGRTPNPDVVCNREIKFRAFLDFALSLGADMIATGHYARVRRRGDDVELLRGIDVDKDQSYFLHTLGQRQLRRTLFPLGGLRKAQVRELARAAGLATSEKKDSTGICFIGERRFGEFLARFLPAQPGPIETADGEVLGEHQGLMFHTIGQRRGLALGGVAGGKDAPWYVIDKDLAHKRLIVAQGRDHPGLFRDSLRADELHWVAEHPPALPLDCSAKIRYRQRDVPCRIRSGGEPGAALRVEFAQPVRAVAPGQSVVFYDGETCLGGGVIQ